MVHGEELIGEERRAKDLLEIKSEGIKGEFVCAGGKSSGKSVVN